MILQTATQANPYVGPRSFRRQDAELFFGRDYEARELTALLLAERIVLLYSPSGAGKTSLIEAKLVPELEERDFEVLPRIRLSQTPTQAGAARSGGTNRYLKCVLDCLELEPADVATDSSMARRFPQRGPRRISRLSAPLNRRAAERGQRAEVLIFDQFEEILTLDPTDLEAKREFFKDIGALLEDATEPRWALFSMREEYVAALTPYLQYLPGRLGTSFRLNLLDYESALAAIQGPAEREGMHIRPDAAAWLVNNLRRTRVRRPSDGEVELVEGPYVEPLHLQIVCRQLWNKVQDKTEDITLDEVQSGQTSGGDHVDHALAEYYAEAVAEIAAKPAAGASERTLRLWIDEHLITKRGLRAQVEKEPITRGLPVTAVNLLEGTRLVRSEEKNGAHWVELTHDRLVPPIQRNNNAWYEAHLSWVQLAALKWRDAGGPKDQLLAGTKLSEAEEWETKHQGEMGEPEKPFLEASKKQRDDLLQKERNRVLRWIVWAVGAGSVLVVLVCVVLGVLSLMLWAATERANSNALAGEARSKALGESAPDTDPEHALMLALLALDRLPDHANKHSAAHKALTEILAESGGRVLTYVDGPDEADGERREYRHNGPIRRMGFTQRLLVTASTDGTLLAWKREELEKRSKLSKPVRLIGHTGPITRFATSKDQKWLATAGLDKKVRLWNLEELEDDAKRYATSEANTVRQNGDKPMRGYAATCLAFYETKDCRWLCTGHSHGGLRLWKLGQSIRTEQPKLWFEAKGNGSRMNAMEIQEEWGWLATSGDDGSVRLWNLKELTAGAGGPEPAKELGRGLLAHDGAITDLNFFTTKKDPNDKQSTSDANNSDLWLITASDDGTARLWRMSALLNDRSLLEESARPGDRGKGDEVARNKVSALNSPLVGHRNRIVDIALTPNDPPLLVTGSIDGTAFLWNLRAIIGHIKPQEQMPVEILGTQFGRQLLKDEKESSVTDIAMWVSPAKEDTDWVAVSRDDGRVWLFAIDSCNCMSEDAAGNIHQFSFRSRVGAITLGRPPDQEAKQLLPLLVTACDDATVRVWKLEDMSWERENLNFSSSMRARLAALEELDPQKLSKIADELVRRRLSQDALDKYALKDPRLARWDSKASDKKSE